MFKSDEFRQLVKSISETTIVNLKGEFKYSVNYKGIQYDYGTGGLHACCDSGIYESNKDRVILDCDVSSLYPSIGVQYGLYPEHLGPEFYEVYKKEIVDVRLAEKAKGKAGNKAIIEGFKEAANIAYGKSNSQWSFLYDPAYTLSITINGQLFLSLLIEQLHEIESLRVLQANTDGITVELNREDINRYYPICYNWEKLTKLSLEYQEYQKMVIIDVNNYAALNSTGKLKYKGRFEIEKELHKNASFLIVPMALSNFFFNSQPIEQTIKGEKSIFPFCGFFRATKGWSCYIQDPYSGKEIEVAKSNRYYVSKDGSFFTKREKPSDKYPSGREILVEEGNLVTIFNRFQELEDYNINYQYYIDRCLDIIKSISPSKQKQLKLF